MSEPLTTATTLPRERYIPLLDGLRCLAILPVLFWHSGLRGLRSFSNQYNLNLENDHLLLPNGHIGVFIFFFISGFVIAAPAFAKGKAQEPLRFYRNRLWRLYAPYILVVIACFLMLVVSGKPVFHADGAPAAHSYLYTSLFASSFFQHQLFLQEHPVLNPPLWSLEIEMQFYLIAPFLLGWLLKFKSVAQYVGLLLVSCLMCGAIGAADMTSFRFDFTLLNYLYLFVLGIIMCRFHPEMKAWRTTKSFRFDLLFVAGLILLFASGFYEELRHTPAWVAFARPLAHVAAVTAIYVGAMYGRASHAFLTGSIAITVGLACYSIYLIHVPFMEVVNKFVLSKFVLPNEFANEAMAIVVLSVLSVLVGLAFYYMVERHFMTRRDAKPKVLQLA
jgi:peptidoglycan/LPS O-acetylase OafA/YrhL